MAICRIEIQTALFNAPNDAFTFGEERAVSWFGFLSFRGSSGIQQSSKK